MRSKAFKGFSILTALLLVGALLGACAAPAPTPTAAPTTAPAPAPTTAPAPAPTAAAAPTTAPAPAPTTAAPAAKQKIVVALDSDLDNLEPTFFKTDAAYYVIANTYQSLLREEYKAENNGQVLMGTLKFKGDGAESITYSPDGKTAILKIRKGMKFTASSTVSTARSKGLAI